MKKLFIICTFTVGSFASAFPFTTSCGIVFNISSEYAQNVTRQALTNTLRNLNFNACGYMPKASQIVYNF